MTTANVRLTIQVGSDPPLFDRRITTRGRKVTTRSGGEHECNCRDNGGGCPHPEPTCTTALANAVEQAGIPWDAKFYESGNYKDFFITSIASHHNKNWTLYLDGRRTGVGGCQQKVTRDQHVLWKFEETRLQTVTDDGGATIMFMETGKEEAETGKEEAEG